VLPPRLVTELLPSWLDPATIIGDYGLWIVLLIIFAECGLLIGFFFPGDSLLFTLGLFIARGDISQPLWLACVLTSIAAIAGNQVGYQIGKAAGPRVFNRPDSRLFRREYVDKTNAFFERYGARAIVLARFVPIVRTFITVTAGVGRMNYRVYTTYTVIGGILWAAGITILGHALGNVDFVAKHIELILIAIVAVSVLPIVVELLRARSKSKDDPQPRPSSPSE
jgi:membrane-associated protein